MNPETEKRFVSLLVARNLVDSTRLEELSKSKGKGDSRHLVQRLCEEGLLERAMASAILPCDPTSWGK